MTVGFFDGVLLAFFCLFLFLSLSRTHILVCGVSYPRAPSLARGWRRPRGPGRADRHTPAVSRKPLSPAWPFSLCLFFPPRRSLCSLMCCTLPDSRQRKRTRRSKKREGGQSCVALWWPGSFLIPAFSRALSPLQGCSGEDKCGGTAAERTGRRGRQGRASTEREGGGRRKKNKAI